MGIRRVQASFRNVQQAVYFDGETLDAEVVVEVTEPTRARNVHVLISGLAQCRWSSNNTHYRGRIGYLGEAVVVWQPAPGQGGDILPTGVHRWAFSYHLPSGLPSSCQVPGGSVSYSMQAIVDIPWGFNKTHEVAFIVLKRIDVSTAALQAPATKNSDKNICCCCCSSGPVTLRATINKRGFRCGDKIQVGVYAQNQSSRDLGPIRVSLVRKTTLQVRGRQRNDSKSVGVVRTQQSLGAGQDLSMQEIKLPVERCSPTVAAQVVFVNYVVEVAVEVPWGVNLTAEFPVIIGTIIRDQEQAEALFQLFNHLVQEAGRRAHIRQGAEEEGLVEVHEPPPAYNDAMDSERTRLISTVY